MCLSTSELDIDLGQDALAVGGGAEGGKVGADGVNQLHVQRAIGLRQRALQHIIGIGVLQASQGFRAVAGQAWSSCPASHAGILMDDTYL